MIDEKLVVCAINKGIKSLIKEQKSDGSFFGNIYFNAWPVATWIMAVNYFGLEREQYWKNWKKRALDWLLEHQNDDGGWGYFYKDSKSLPSLTYLCVKALESLDKKLDNVNVAIRKAQRYLSTKETDPEIFTKFFLSVVSKRPLDDIKWFPWLFALLPDPLFEKIFSAWTQDVVISGCILKLKDKINRSFFNIIYKPIINVLIKRLLSRQLEDGSWFGTYQPTLFAMLALKSCNDSYDGNISKGVKFVKTLIQSNGYISRFTLPVWDSSLALFSLMTAYEVVSDNIRKSMIGSINKCVQFLLDSQFDDGSYGFKPEVKPFPDADDTSMVVAALLKYLNVVKPNNGDKILKSISKSMRWLLKMQKSNGGWEAFTKKHTNDIFKCLKSFYDDPKVALMDPAVPDVTAHVLMSMGKYGYNIKDKKVNKAIKFLKSTQNFDGSWYGRWGLCYIYGTSAVLMGLEAVGENMNKKYVRKAIQWLKKVQNDDGGWGEKEISYFMCNYMKGSSTVEHTSWAILGLLRSTNPDWDIIEKGVNFLIQNQNEDGSWPSSPVVAALDVYENTIYCKIFPLLALSEYIKRCKNDRR